MITIEVIDYKWLPLNGKSKQAKINPLADVLASDWEGALELLLLRPDMHAILSSGHFTAVIAVLNILLKWENSIFILPFPISGIIILSHPTNPSIILRTRI